MADARARAATEVEPDRGGGDRRRLADVGALLARWVWRAFGDD